jgi:predicted dehydrogenase
MQPTWGIIGCGKISRFHFSGLRKTGATVCHIADTRTDAARPYVEATGAAYSADYHALLADPRVSVVSVLTDSPLHHRMCIDALDAGKDVVCEKTLADNPDEAEDIVNAARRNDRLCFTSYMKRFFPATRKAYELLPSLGRLFSAQVRTYQDWGDYFNLTEEQARTVPQTALQKYGGAIMKCAASHLIDLTLSFVGRPARLYANVDYVPGTQFDRKATALFEYDSGMVVSFESAMHPLKRIGYERNAWDESVQINGTHGRLELFPVRWDQPEKNGALLVHYDNALATSTEYRFPAVSPFDLEITYFADCLARREQGHPSAVDGFNVDMIIWAMAESHRRKAAFDLDWRGL